ncbi:MAG: lipoyl synthase, partial [Spirochaetales bacterium]|nr:lipoyl synthase [Spirochaetales bacterium]
RNCRFCAVATARSGAPLDPEEPARLANAIQTLGLRYAVITSVDRDDLPDRGASHFAACIRAIRAEAPDVRIEVLIPDYVDEELGSVLDAAPDVLAHNVETVRRLQHVRDHRASFDKSLMTLRQAAARGLVTKSSLLLGLGEQQDEVHAAMRELRDAGVSILVLGQYLQPTPAQVEVAEYVHPDIFKEYEAEGLAMGFTTVVAAPFARTSYHAREAWEQS